MNVDAGTWSDYDLQLEHDNKPRWFSVMIGNQEKAECAWAVFLFTCGPYHCFRAVEASGQQIPDGMRLYIAKMVDGDAVLSDRAKRQQWMTGEEFAAEVDSWPD